MKKYVLLIGILFSGYLNAQVAAGPINDQIICDSSLNNGFDRIDLTSFNLEALGNQSPNLFTVSYFETQQEATTNTNPVLATDYTNTTNPQTMFVRVENVSNGNFAVTTIRLFVANQPTGSGVTAATVCAISTAIGTIVFDIDDVASIIQQMNPSTANFQVSYFYNQIDADANVNAIPSNSTVTLMTSGTVLFRRYSELNTAQCYGVEAISIFAANCGQNQLQDLYVCEDANGLGCFDLSINDLPALGNNSTNTHSVSYHLIQADAANNTNPVPPTYCSQVGNQQVFVRVEEIATGTEDATQSFFINVNETPDLYSFTPVVGCDVDADGLIEWESISVINEITNVPNNNFTLQYYLTQADADNQVNSVGFMANFTTLTGLNIVYVRTQFDATGCASVSPLQLIENNNCFTAGSPNDLIGCLQTPNTVACFDLSENESLIMGINNPVDFTIFYYDSLIDARAGFNPITSATNYCIGSSEVIHARLEQNLTGNYYTVPFDLLIQTLAFDFNTLTDLSECDDDLNSSVIFDLTDFASQLNTTNPITYFPTSQDAQNGSSAIQSPAAFEILVANGTRQIFLLETVTNDCDIIYSGTIRPQGNCNNAYDCSNAQSLCERIGQPFINVFDGSNAVLGNYYPFSSSLGPRNPTWFYIPIETSGDITLEVYQNSQADFMGQDLDIDFVIYGPFTNPTSQCGNLTITDYVDHSFSIVMPEIGQINNAQSGEFYLILTSNFSNQPGFLKVELGAGSTATVNCDGIKMQSFLDVNLNGVVDAADQSFPLGVFEWERNSSGNIMQVATPLGSYSIYDIDPINSYDLAFKVLPAYALNYRVSPATYAGVTVPANSGEVNKYFLVTPIAAYEDVVVYILPQNQPRPGFMYKETVYYANLGSLMVPVGQVVFDYDPALNIVNVTDPSATITPASVTISYATLAPFEIRSFDVEMQIPTIPAVTLGDLLTNVAVISPVTNDLTPSNNTSTSVQIIIGSYDPNDKMESRGEFINPAAFGPNDYFFYTVRFENTGTASAINVRIEDTLDAQLDWNSIEMIDASHNYVMERIEEQVVWRFDTIMLPDATTDPVGANGHVYFKIKPLAFSEGTAIPNTAEIYFDFNPAIITNTFTTTFRTPLSNPDVEETVFSLTPNPASNQIRVNFNQVMQVASITLYDLRGRVTLLQKLTQNQLQIDISELKKGVYLAKFVHGDQTYTSKLIKK
jgi:uncharacterized repeat protein (TIGR01451 family)